MRHFDARPVADAEMRRLIEAADLAPSVGNAQPWRIVRIRSPALRDRIAGHVDAHAAAAGAGYDDERGTLYATLKLHGIREAPELIAIFCDERPVAGHGLGAATMAETLRYSCVMAIHGMWLTARARGIGLGWVSILDPAHVARLLDVPGEWALIGLLCIGYPIDPAAIPELERRGWQARETLAGKVTER